MTDLGTLGGTYSYATAINEQGQVVGISLIGSEMHAFIWHNGRMTDLGTLGGGWSQVSGINEQGTSLATVSPPAGTITPSSGTTGA